MAHCRVAVQSHACFRFAEIERGGDRKYAPGSALPVVVGGIVPDSRRHATTQCNVGEGLLRFLGACRRSEASCCQEYGNKSRKHLYRACRAGTHRDKEMRFEPPNRAIADSVTVKIVRLLPVRCASFRMKAGPASICPHQEAPCWARRRSPGRTTRSATPSRMNSTASAANG